MNIIKEWESRLRQVEKELEDYKDIITNRELNQDMKAFCLSKMQSRNQYKKLIEKTLHELMKNKTNHLN